MRDKIKEYDEVAKAAENFVRTVAEGNSEHARKLFTDDASAFRYFGRRTGTWIY